MFKGIIECIGTVTKKSPGGNSINFKIDFNQHLTGIKAGDSIAVNGVCLTAEDASEESFTTTAVKETLTKTNLGYLSEGSTVNIERAVLLSDRIDGHLVQGHVDTTGRIVKINSDNITREYFIELPSQFRANIIHTGSITIDGVSLTIADIDKSENLIIKIAVIPFTFEHTIFNTYKTGSIVNVELDMIGKYIERILSKSTAN